MAILLGNDIKKLADGVAVDPYSGSAQGVYTTPAGRQVVVTSLVLRCTAASGVGSPATAKVEINPAAGDIFTDESLIGVTALDTLWRFVAEAGGQVVPAATQIDVTITNPAVGGTQTLVADLFGYII